MYTHNDRASHEPAYFQQLTLADLPLVMGIERAASPAPWSATMMRDAMTCAFCKTYGIFLPGEGIVGFAVLSTVVDEAEIMLMAIHPQYHRKGYGEQLLAFLMQQAALKHAGKLMLEVRESNASALSLYLKKGFHQTGIRKQYYRAPTPDEQRENAILMSCALPA